MFSIPHKANRQATHARIIPEQIAVWQVVFKINIQNSKAQYNGISALQIALEKHLNSPTVIGPAHAYIALQVQIPFLSNGCLVKATQNTIRNMTNVDSSVDLGDGCLATVA